jgi:crotonobetaine/carnitine-CoA ligase
MRIVDPPPLDDPAALAAGTLVHALEARAERDPDTPFVTVGARPPLTPAALLALVRRFSEGLERHGIAEGDRVLLALDSSPEFLVAWLGLGHRGAVMVPVVPRSGLRAFRRAVELCEPRLAIANAGGSAKLRQLDAIDGVPVIEVDDRNTGSLCPAFDGQLLAADGAAEPNGARGQQLASIMFTSGTTGPPKGVRVAHLWYVWASLDVAGAMRYTSRDVLYTCLPLGHANAQDTSFGPALVTGARIVLDPDFSASRFWARLAETGSTAFNLIGNMPAVLLDRPEAEFVRHRAWRAFSVPALAHQLEPFRERFGVQLVEGYGSTEIGVPVFQDLDAIRPGASGRPLPGTRIRILREDGLPAPPGARGEICAWSDRPGSCTAGYYRDDEATARAWSGGWFRTGDLGVLDEDGYLQFAGRVTDSMRRKGENISAFEVETTLLELDDVAACGVVGRPRPDGDDDVIAFVVPAEGRTPDPERLVAHCAVALGAVAAPVEVHVVDSLPQTESGKVAKGELRARVAREDR